MLSTAADADDHDAHKPLQRCPCTCAALAWPALRCAPAQSTVQKRTDGVSDRQAELQRIGEQLEEIRANMDEKGQNISDSTPVMRIKNAIKKLNEELHDMEVRIGVVSHTLLQLSLKNRREMQAAAAVPEEDEDD